MQAIKLLYFCSEIPPNLSYNMALSLYGNPTMVYASIKMVTLLRGSVGNNKIPLFLMG